MDGKHTHIPEECQLEHIQDVADSCDNEYYMSAIGLPIGNRKRAERGRARIKQWVSELDTLRGTVKCLACHEEIKRQIALQRRALQDIESVWGAPA